ncbi:hypothetical protein O4H49_11720 [Kiloniella laminariae]|uniref:Transglutaminase-like domain-containing protein n=1 Tax=Kiloniella laminariae TaxID=454162 RepID=A0ABT4LK24_9PROT|nr:hypothetical protein [Kiloniella laminariae]MCZ4281450.1 hypothetical protein [Kiloniella laminariae]
MFSLAQWPVFLGVILLLGGCAAGRNSSPMMIFERKGVAEPTIEAFQYCHGYGCQTKVELSLNELEKSGLVEAFGIAATPREERAAMARAVAYMEKLNGPKTGTDKDIGGTFTGYGEPGQLDCEDEATNTTTTLIFLRDLGLLKHHRLRSQVTRGFFFGGWPHTSAAVIEISSGKSYVIDSWFENSGVVPHIVPYDIWSSGWDPAKDGPIAEETF